MRSTITAQPGLQSLYSTGSGGGTAAFAGRTGFVALAMTRLAVRFTGLRLPAVLVVLVARIRSALTGGSLSTTRFLASVSLSCLLGRRPTYAARQ
jgi:hypothetical protein